MSLTGVLIGINVLAEALLKPRCWPALRHLVPDNNRDKQLVSWGGTTRHYRGMSSVVSRGREVSQQDAFDSAGLKICLSSRGHMAAQRKPSKKVSRTEASGNNYEFRALQRRAMTLTLQLPFHLYMFASVPSAC